MIQGHSIKNDGNEQILYLYLDYQYEFSEFGTNDNKKGFLEQIKNYLKFNKINFNGRKVVLVVAGITFGILLLNNVDYKNYSSVNNDYSYVNKIILNNYDDDFKLNDQYEIVINEESKEDIIVQENISASPNIVKEEISAPLIKKDVEIKKPDTDKKSSVNINESINNTGENFNNIDSEATKIELEVVTENEIIPDNKKIVTVYRSNGTVVEMELEEYVVGVVGAEMPASFNIEALKAQAIAARTYATYFMESNIILTDTVKTQVYKDNSQLKSMWGSDFTKYYNKVVSAVEATRDMHITYNGQTIRALYFSTSNGYTEDSINVWGNSFAYLKSVDSSWDKSASSFLRTITKTFDEMSSSLGYEVNQNTVFEVTSRNSSGRVEMLSINDNTYSGVEFRNKFGLRSADFDIVVTSNGIEITTRGYGHGVGMSQYGANGMANMGYNYSQIINHYYQGVKIETK